MLQQYLGYNIIRVEYYIITGMPKAKTHVVFVGDSYIVRFEAAIGVHPDIPHDLKLSSCRASFVARRGAN